MRNTLKRHGFKCAEHTDARLSTSTCPGDSSDPETDSDRPLGWGLVRAGSREARDGTQPTPGHQALLQERKGYERQTQLG